MSVQKANIGKWLYIDTDDSRMFSKLVILGKDAQPLEECTDAEKEQWERDHAPREVQEVEVVE